MVDFINEVEEELRKDDYNRLLKKYGPFIGVLLFLIVAGTAFIQWRGHANDKAARATAAIYTSADDELEAGSLDQAVEEFVALGQKGPDGYAGLAFTRAAAIENDKGNSTGAVAYFDQSSSKFDKARHKQLSELKAAYLLADQGAYSDVIARLDGLIVEDAPYEYLARELLGFAHEKSGNLSDAREQYAYLSSIPGVPQTVKLRAEQSLLLMNVDSAINAPKEISPQTTPEDIAEDSALPNDTPTNETTPSETPPSETEETDEN